nr:hypothetical protein [Tanacetum cinerariifolium]
TPTQVYVIIRSDGYAYPVLCYYMSEWVRLHKFVCGLALILVLQLVGPLGCKVMRTLTSVEIEILMILRLSCCLSSSSVRCLKSSSRVPVPLPEDPYEAIRQAYLVGTDTESEPFEDLVETETPESPHIVAPPTCHVEESKGSGTSGARSTSSDFTVPLSPDHPLTHTTPALVPILSRTTRMAVRVLPAMSPGLSAGIAEVAAMSDSAFRKRVRSFYDSLPSPTLPVRKRYRGTSELILDTDGKEDEEVEESSDTNNKSEDAEDEGPTVEDEDLAIGEEGLAVGEEGPGMGVGSHGLDDESCGLHDEGHSVESDGFGLEEDEAVPEGQQRAVLVVETAVSEPLGRGYGVLRRRELALEEDHVYCTFEVDPEDGMVCINIPAYPPLAPPAQTPPSPEWLSGSFPIFPAPSIVLSPIPAPMVSLTVPSPIASTVATLTSTILVDEDQFIESDRDVRKLYTRSGETRDEIFSQRYRFRSLKHEQERTVVTFKALWRPVLALEAWAGRFDTRMTDMSRTGYDDRMLVHDMLLQQTALQRELQEMGGHITTLEQERDRREW